jgi:hypothetical protein
VSGKFEGMTASLAESQEKRRGLQPFPSGPRQKKNK